MDKLTNSTKTIDWREVWRYDPFDANPVHDIIHPFEGSAYVLI